MSIEDRFYAAVNVISGLPKHGPYQPSNEMKLSFYAFYKQATEGANTETKPWSWEVVKKAKWDSWKRLGDMSREEAMARYVQELNKIVETMSYTENVADFLKSMDDFNSQESDKDVTSTSEALDKPAAPTSTGDDSPVRTPSVVREESVDDDEDELYTDSVESAFVSDKGADSDATLVVANGHPKGDGEGASEHHRHTTDILMRTVLTMRTELNEITASVRKIEQKQKCLYRRSGLFRGLTTQTVAFIVLWPIAANLVLVWLYYRRRLQSLR